MNRKIKIAFLLLVVFCSSCLSVNKNITGLYEIRNKNSKEVIGNLTVYQDSIYEQSFFNDSAVVICGTWSKKEDTIILKENQVPVEPEIFIISGRKLKSFVKDTLTSKELKFIKTSNKVDDTPKICYQECYREFYQNVERAEIYFNNKSYLLAKQFYQKALRLKCVYAKCEYIQQQLELIDKILKKQERSLEIQRQEIQQQYDNWIKKGDDAYLIGDYKKAKKYYEDAKRLKPHEQYPYDKIYECDKLIQEK